MTENNQIVEENLVVSLDYVLKLDNDEVIDRSEENTPLEYLHGHNNIVPGLESELEGLKIGDEKKVTVPPNLGYGERDPESVAEYPRDTFPVSLKLEVGEPIAMARIRLAVTNTIDRARLALIGTWHFMV